MSTIILGITGSIAAYKAANIASQLTQSGHDVHCICSEKALDFITVTTLQTLSRNKVWSSFDEEKLHWPPPHIDLAAKADLFVVAPATANTIAQFTYGLAPNVLTSIYLACQAPVLICPAMNEHMWKHCTTQHNIDILSKRDKHVIYGPDQSGSLACGTSGTGRMMPVKKILEQIHSLLDNK